MRIQSSPQFSRPTFLQHRSSGDGKNSPFRPSQDQFQTSSFLPKATEFGAGMLLGGVGFGTPAALGAGAIKCMAAGHPVIGVGLAAAAVGVGSVSIPLFTAVGVMTTDAGSMTGFRGFVTGAALSVGVAAASLF
ncbi:hypothetical protein JST97_02990 [bacterium]|nr:hypothetical protein [bacterium]